MTRTLALIGLSIGCACSADDERFTERPPFDDPEHVQNWAHTASSLGVYAHAYDVIAFADGEHAYPDPSCPVTEDDGATVTITGGCTDDAENAWTGSATIERDGDDRLVTFDDFEEKIGSAALRSLGGSLYEFEVDLVIGAVTTIDYAGTVEGGYGERTVWNGSGRVEREGMLPPVGTVDATTVDEVLDEAVCPQPASGTTTLHSRGDTAVVTYDGAVDCDDEQSVRLTVNGEDRGRLSGVYCAVGDAGAVRAPGGAELVVLGALAVLGATRRRRRSG